MMKRPQRRHNNSNTEEKTMLDHVRQDEAREVEKGHFDPYQLDPSHVLEPPTNFGEIMRKTGPGMVLAASIVGSGELILTTTLGAKVGYTMMWLIILSCLIKAVVQAFLGRYTIAVAFYLLGAEILHGMGLVPSTSDMIPILSNIYTQTL